MKQMLRLLVIVPLMIGFVVTPVFAGDSRFRSSPMSSEPCETFEDEESCPPGELILVDTLVLRPLGLVALGIGLAGSLLTMPFAATSCSGPCPEKELVQKPFEYTFCRPLGEIDH